MIEENRHILTDDHLYVDTDTVLLYHVLEDQTKATHQRIHVDHQSFFNIIKRKMF